MKKYIVFAGVNGAGKSTLYKTFSKFQDMPRVNTDEILRSFGNWRIEADLMKAGKMAVHELNEYLESGISFNQETTLCGKSITAPFLPDISYAMIWPAKPISL